MSSFLPHPFLAFWGLLLGLVLIFSGLRLRGSLRRKKVGRSLLRALPLILALGLSFLIMAQAEHFRYQSERRGDIPFQLVDPALRLGRLLSKWLPAAAEKVTRAVLAAEGWAKAHRKAAILYSTLALPVILLLIIVWKWWKNPFPLLLLLISLSLGVITIIFTQQNHFPASLPFGAAAAILIVVYILLTRKNPPVKPLSGNGALILLFLVIIGALCFRSYQLYSVAARFDNWEAGYGQETLKILSGRHPIYLWNDTRWRGLGHTSSHSPVYLYLLSFFFRVFGPNLVALRLVPAVCGVLTVYFSYAFFRLIFNNTLALISAALLAFSPLHVNYSRTPHLTSITLMTGYLILYLLFRAIIRRSYSSYLLLGLIFSFMGYLYEPIMIFFPLSCLFVLVYIFSQRRFLRRHWLGIILTGLIIFLVIELFHIPVWGRMFPKLFVKESVWHRTQTHHYTVEADYIRGIPLIAENIQKLFFSFIRDGKFNYDIWPQGNLYFNPLLSAFLLWGLLYSVLNLDKARFRIILFLAVVFLPSNILSRPPVIVRRLLFLFPLLYFFSALPLYCLWEELSKLFSGWGRRVAALIIGTTVILVGSYNAGIYFDCQTPAGRWEIERFFDEYAKKYIDDYYLLILPTREDSKPTIDFLLWEKVKTGRTEDYYKYITRDMINRSDFSETPVNKPKAIICFADQVSRAELERFKDRLGQGRIEEHHDKFGRLNALAFFSDAID